MLPLSCHNFLFAALLIIHGYQWISVSAVKITIPDMISMQIQLSRTRPIEKKTMGGVALFSSNSANSLRRVPQNSTAVRDEQEVDGNGNNEEVADVAG